MIPPQRGVDVCREENGKTCRLEFTKMVLHRCSVHDLCAPWVEMCGPHPQFTPEHVPLSEARRRTTFHTTLLKRIPVPLHRSSCRKFSIVQLSAVSVCHPASRRGTSCNKNTVSSFTATPRSCRADGTAASSTPPRFQEQTVRSSRTDPCEAADLCG